MPRTSSPSLQATALRLHATEVRAGRMARGLTQRQVAQTVGVNLGTYRKYEYALCESPEPVRERLAALLGIERGRLGLDPEHACPCCGAVLGG